MAKKVTKKQRPSKKKSLSMRWIWWILLPMGILGGVLVWYNSQIRIETPHHFRKTIPKGFNSVGIDVSHHQGEIDWDELFDEKGFDTLIDFVYCKTTEGGDHFDKQWERNRKILNDKGILNGAYHYFKFQSDPILQARHFIRTWKQRDIDLPPALDVEDEPPTTEELIEKMRIWLHYVEGITGMRPIIYTSLNFYETKFKNQFPGYLFWIAAYSRKPEYLDEKQVIHWQFSETGRLPGISEKVDLNVSKLDY